MAVNSRSIEVLGVGTGPTTDIARAANSCHRADAAARAEAAEGKPLSSQSQRLSLNKIDTEKLLSISGAR
jgi:hypothetical protein